MGTKRRVHSTRSSDIIKRSKACSSTYDILTLPSEILDLIISYTIELPTEIKHGVQTWRCVPQLMATNILQVCRVLRQRAISFARNACLWFRVTVHSRDALRIMNNINGSDCGRTMPVLSEAHIKSLGEDLPNTIHIQLDETSEHLIRTRGFSPKRFDFFFPHNYDSFLRLVAGLKTTLIFLKKIEVNVSHLSENARRLYHSQVRPVLENVHSVFKSIRFEFYDEGNPSYNLPSPLSPEMIEGQSILRGLSYRVRAGMKLADDLRRQGSDEEADLWLLYSGRDWYAFGNCVLPLPHQWAQGESDPDQQDYEDLRCASRNPIGNELRTLLVRMQYESCVGYWKLYQKYGPDFVQSHHVTVAQAGSRWTQMPPHGWFGLTDQERAQMYYCYAVVVRIKIEVYWSQNLREPNAEPNNYHDDDGDEDDDIRHDERLARAVGSVKAACALDPENETYRDLLQWCFQFLDSKEFPKMSIHPGIYGHYQLDQREVLAQDFTIRLPTEIASATGSTHWTGQWWMYYKWEGGLHNLVYLPLAQKMPGPDDSSEELSESQ